MAAIDTAPQLSSLAQEITPPIPETIQECGLPEAMIEQLIMKTLYFRNETIGREISVSLGLKFSVIESIMEYLKHQHLVQVRRSLGLGNISAVYALTDNGRTVAREHLEANQYAGKAPVPLEQYATVVKLQRQRESWLSLEMLHSAFRHMVVTPQLLNAIGPAINSGKSFLIYGQPGNGKTYLAEALFDLDPTPIYVPYAVESQGMIIQMYDPIYHSPIKEPEAESVLTFAYDPSYDQRWFQTRRPFIVSGGELDMSMLDLSFNPVSKFYDAPLQMKANNGIYLIDDFGRQRATPAEILNRWIVPMERRIDYLTFQNGTKMHVPFDAFLIFSTNLKPHNLGDEAFLRRIQYKMLMRSPGEDEFTRIFEKFCESKKLPMDEGVLDSFLAERYRAAGKPMRRCHPRDVLNHAIDIIRFEKREWRLTAELLDHAFESCFVNTTEDD